MGAGERGDGGGRGDLREFKGNRRKGDRQKEPDESSIKKINPESTLTLKEVTNIDVGI